MVPSAEHLVEHHLDALYGLAKAWVHDHDLAEDLTHRTFLKAFERRGQLRDPGAARAWLVAILRNEMVSEFRRRGREVAWDREDFEDLVDPTPEAEVPTDRLVALPAAFDCLADAFKDILLLRFQQELSYEAIAQLLGLPLGTVMSRLHRAKIALRSHLEAHASAGGVR